MLRSMIQLVAVLAVIAGLMALIFALMGETPTAILFGVGSIGLIYLCWRRREWMTLP